MRNISLAALFALIIGACIAVLWLRRSENSPRVVYAKQLELDAGSRCDSIDLLRTPFKREVFIIQNAPKGHAQLMGVVRNNESFAPIAKEVVEKRYTTFSRIYYRESKNTPVDFRDGHGGYFSRDYVDDHAEDRICEINMERRDWIGVPDSLRLTWTCNCTETGDTIIEYRSANP
jgi:hypothetical protein